MKNKRAAGNLAMPEKIDFNLFAREVAIGWDVLSEEFGKKPEERARLQKCRERKAELIFDDLQRELKIPPGDPFAVVKALVDYWDKAGLNTINVLHKISDNELVWELSNALVPIFQRLRRQSPALESVRVPPGVDMSILNVALRKLSKVKMEWLPTPPDVEASVLKGREKEWVLVPTMGPFHNFVPAGVTNPGNYMVLKYIRFSPIT